MPILSLSNDYNKGRFWRLYIYCVKYFVLRKKDSRLRVVARNDKVGMILHRRRGLCHQNYQRGEGINLNLYFV